MNENARNLLKGYATTERRIAALTSELQHLSVVPDAIRSANLPAECRMDLAVAAGSVEELVAEIKEEICKASSRCKLIVEAISSLENEEMQAVMELHYLSGMTLEEITDELCCCLTKVKVLHRRGLSAVEQYLVDKQLPNADA